MANHQNETSKLVRLTGVELEVLDKMAAQDRCARIYIVKHLIRREAEARGLLPNPYLRQEVVHANVHAGAEGEDQPAA